MTSLATQNFKLLQIYPGAGTHHLNTCANPDCYNFGREANDDDERRAAWAADQPNRSEEQLDLVFAHGPGAYKLAGADNEYKRVSRAFEHEKQPLEWTDQRTVRCKAQLRCGTICNTGFSILSDDHLRAEVERLRNYNGVLDGPACRACGVRYLAKPEEFVLNGAHQRTKNSKGDPIINKGAPKAVRVLHKPCKGKKGARFSISLPHERQKITKDNLRILGALLNSAGILDVQRMLGTEATGKRIGIARIYDRIAWLEEVFLAYEREILRRWKRKVELSGDRIEHRLSHDDVVLSVNWETATECLGRQTRTSWLART